MTSLDASGGRKNPWPTVGLGCLVLLGALWLVGRLGDSTRSSGRKAGVGEKCSLVRDDGKMIVLVGRAELWDRYATLVKADDSLGLIQLAASSGGAIVDSGTQCLVIDRGYERREVRITSGPKIGTSGWTFASLVRPAS